MTFAMNSRTKHTMIRSPVTHAIVATLLVSAFGSTLASEIYRHVDKDGRVTYSDIPPAKAGVPATIQVPQHPGVSEEDLARERAARDARLREIGAELGTRREEQATRHEQIAAARQDVERHRAALEQGRAPQPGERLGTAAGGSRLSPSYFERIAKLEGALAEAEAKLNALQN
jgi:hypothetical protein